MVSIVIVSHSKKIADGIIDLGNEMVNEKVKVVSAAGLDDDKLGTDANKVLVKIKEVYSKDGVIIIADIGSSIMSTELAIDMLDEGLKENVVLADAPIVEGSIVAIVEASVGSSLARVKEACEDSKNYSKIN